MLTYNEDSLNINKISRIPERRINVGQTQGFQQRNYNPNLGEKNSSQIPSSFGNNDGSQNNNIQIGRNRVFGTQTQSKDSPQSLVETKYQNNDQSRNHNLGLNTITGMSNTYTENKDYGFLPKESPQKQQILPPRVRNGAQSQDKYNDSYGGTKNSLFSEKPLLVVRDQFELREEQLREQLKKQEKEKLDQYQKERDEQMASKENQKRQNKINYSQDQKLRLAEYQSLKDEKIGDDSKEQQSPVHYNALTQNNNLRNTQTKSFTGTYQPNALNQDLSAQKLRKGYTIEESKPIIINNEEKLAVATGIEENPIEDSTQIEEELFPCTEGCGRLFVQRALEKHIPICKKVFLQKRNEFNTQQKRIVDADQAKLSRQAIMKEKMESTKVKKTDKNNKQKDMMGTKSNWKEESEKLRQQIKLNKQPKQK